MKLLLPLAFAFAAFTAALLLRAAPVAIAADLRQPLAVVTYWHHFGSLFAWLLIGACAFASIAYVRCIARPPSLRATAALCALACACALAFPVVFSSDVYAYAGYGDMLLHHLNPYAHARVTVRSPLMDAVVWQWGNPPPACAYGPVFLLLAQGAALLQSISASAPLWALRICTCAALVACAPLAAAASGANRPRGLRAAAVLSLNPVAIWSAAEGHNDALAIALALAAVAAALRQRTWTCAILLALGGAFKAPAVLAAAAIARKNAAAAVCGLLAAAMLSLPLIAAALYTVAPAARYSPQFSPQYAFAQVFPAGVSIGLTIVLALVVALAGRLRGAHLAFALWMCIPNPYPWYGVWLLAVAALTRNPRARNALVAASLLGVLRYYGEATGALPALLDVAIVALAYGVPAIMLVTVRNVRASFGRPGSRTGALGLAPTRPA
jgi:hypothetical protein